MSRSQHTRLLGRDVIHAQLLAVADEGEQQSVRAEYRCGIRAPAVAQTRLAGICEAVEVDLVLAVAIADVSHLLAIRRPRNLVLIAGGARHARSLSRFARARREDLAMRDKSELAAIRRKLQI